MRKRLDRSSIIEFIKSITGAKESQEIFKNYINLDGDNYQLQFLQHKSFGVTFKDIVFVSEKNDTNIYHNEIKRYLQKLYPDNNITLKTTSIFSLI